EGFGSPVIVVLNKLDDLFSATKGEMPEYKTLARLYDTFGTPRDLIRVSMEVRGFAIDEEQFNESFDATLQELQERGASDKAEGKTKTSPALVTVSSNLAR